MQVARVIAFCLLLLTFSAGADVLSEAQERFRNVLADRVRELEKTNTPAFAGEHGWFCLTANLRLLAAEKFWGDAAPKISRSRNPKWADPIPAIVDFHRQLEQRGIKLLLVPVPPKAAIYPEEFFPGTDLHEADAAPFLHRFYDELREKGVDVVDMTSTFLANRTGEHGALYCKSDSHWSGIGCVLTAQAIAEKIRGALAATEPPRLEFNAEWKKVSIEGDLQKLVDRSQRSVGTEEISLRQVSQKSGGAPIAADPNSPVLILGDSHVLVFHDFLAERAGLLDQLAFELGFAPDVLGTRGSAATAVRINFYRHNLSDPNYLAKKKLVVWCFAAREFTETEQGWVPEPVAK